MVTETDEVAAALDLAATAWPGVSRGQLLRRLIEQGRRALEAERSDEAYQRRLAEIKAIAGGFAGCYDLDYRERLRNEWPE